MERLPVDPRERHISQPDIHLITGEDFVYDEEIIDVIEERLLEHDLQQDQLLLCGHSTNGDTTTLVRTHIFAYTLAQAREQHHYGEMGPVDHASYHAKAHDGLPTIGVYDGRLLDQHEQISERYQVQEPEHLQDALVARFIIQ